MHYFETIANCRSSAILNRSKNRRRSPSPVTRPDTPHVEERWAYVFFWRALTFTDVLWAGYNTPANKAQTVSRYAIPGAHSNIQPLTWSVLEMVYHELGCIFWYGIVQHLCLYYCIFSSSHLSSLKIIVHDLVFLFRYCKRWKIFGNSA